MRRKNGAFPNEVRDLLEVEQVLRFAQEGSLYVLPLLPYLLPYLPDGSLDPS
jgi:hypothetical protein